MMRRVAVGSHLEDTRWTPQEPYPKHDLSGTAIDCVHWGGGLGGLSGAAYYYGSPISRVWV